MISAHELNFFILLFLIFLPPQQPALICLELVSILYADSWELKGPQSAVLGGKPWISSSEFLENYTHQTLLMWWPVHWIKAAHFTVYYPLIVFRVTEKVPPAIYVNLQVNVQLNIYFEWCSLTLSDLLFLHWNTTVE